MSWELKPYLISSLQWDFFYIQQFCSSNLSGVSRVLFIAYIIYNIKQDNISSDCLGHIEI